MLELFRPRFEGSLELPGLPADFPARIAARVERGLLVPGRRNRANYRVLETGPDAVRFAAGDWSTGINLGLNAVRIEREGAGRLHYEVVFPVWARYVRVLSAGIGSVLALCSLIPAVAAEIDAYPGGLAWFWGAVLFWGLVWPHLLVALHKRAAARFLERVLREELVPQVRAGA